MYITLSTVGKRTIIMSMHLPCVLGLINIVIYGVKHRIRTRGTKRSRDQQNASLFWRWKKCLCPPEFHSSRSRGALAIVVAILAVRPASNTLDRVFSNRSVRKRWHNESLRRSETSSNASPNDTLQDILFNKHRRKCVVQNELIYSLQRLEVVGRRDHEFQHCNGRRVHTLTYVLSVQVELTSTSAAPKERFEKQTLIPGHEDLLPRYRDLSIFLRAFEDQHLTTTQPVAANGSPERRE